MLTLQMSIILLLILLNGFFAMAEIALVSARPARLQPLAAQGSRGAEAALELKSDPSRLLATVQIGITIIAVLSGTIGEATLGDAFQAIPDRTGRVLGRLLPRDQHGGGRHRHFVSVADPRRAGAEADRADPSRTDRRRPGPA